MLLAYDAHPPWRHVIADDPLTRSSAVVSRGAFCPSTFVAITWNFTHFLASTKLIIYLGAVCICVCIDVQPCINSDFTLSLTWHIKSSTLFQPLWSSPAFLLPFRSSPTPFQPFRGCLTDLLSSPDLQIVFTPLVLSGHQKLILDTSFKVWCPPPVQ